MWTKSKASQRLLVEQAVEILMERWELDYEASAVAFGRLADELGVSMPALAPVVVAADRAARSEVTL